MYMYNLYGVNCWLHESTVEAFSCKVVAVETLFRLCVREGDAGRLLSTSSRPNYRRASWVPHLFCQRD